MNLRLYMHSDDDGHRFPRDCLQPRIGGTPRHYVSSQSFYFLYI